MNDLFFFRADMFPFPGTYGVEYLSLLFWRNMLWIVICCIILLGVDKLTEWPRTHLHGKFGRFLPSVILLASFAVVPASFFFIYTYAPECEFVIQWNTPISVSEIVFLSIALLLLAKFADGFIKRCWRYGFYRTFLSAGVWLIAVGGVVFIVSSLSWRKTAYRPVWLALVEFVVSLVVVSLVVVLISQKTWRCRGWKSIMPKLAWLGVAVCIFAGVVALFGVWGLLSNSCS